MTPEEPARLVTLDAVLRSNSVRKEVHSIVQRVRAELVQNKNAVMAWEPIPLSIFDRALPGEIQSAWVFVLRAGVNTGPERHPNSHQRMMSFEGSGDLQTGEPGRWHSNVLVSNTEASLNRRWISIPPSVWHRPVVGKDEDWVVVSFHTVAAEELIEERPDDSSDAGTRQMKYLGS